ncbi:hypothetical protein [Xylanimonas protaetiae]|uniref:Antitoxin n=1 Tax=Xylanimonas protaetiae TaxID=2509457 RepID=A0A4P6F7P4_9MICO|nr:hypothetical protein [Xylanimonas protaetiae]QAY69277.1 hypothetical protein ET471_03860 [Xylanimonas protaetiae]
MTTTLSLTEFNQNPSRATRLADDGEVIVLRRGAAAYRLTKVEHPEDPIDALIQSGLATPPRKAAKVTRFKHTATDQDAGALLDADRDRLGY